MVHQPLPPSKKAVYAGRQSLQSWHPRDGMSGGGEQIVNLNVGGHRFATSKHTLTWIPDSFFTCLLSGRIPTVRDDSGAIFIDRDPEIFRVILNYLRTKQVDLTSVSLPSLKHEALFYGLGPLIRRLTLCEELEVSHCGDVLFHALIPAPQLPDIEELACEEQPQVVPTKPGNAKFQTHSTSDSCDTESSASSSSRLQSGSPDGDSSHQEGAEWKGAGSQSAKRAPYGDYPATWAGPASSKHRIPSHNRTGSADIGSGYNSPRLGTPLIPATLQRRSQQDLTKYIKNELNELMKGSKLGGLRPGEGTGSDAMRVRTIRAHHNSVAVAYTYYVCVYRMKESVGWQTVYISPRLESPVRHVALNTKFGPQGGDKVLAAALADGSIHLWSIAEGTGQRKVGVFSLTLPVDNLFFIGSQLVALSKTGKVGIWHSMTQNWQVQDVVAISCYDTAGSSLLLGCTNGSMYYIDMQKFPLRMKDNDLLITELYRDPNADAITAISVYLTPKTNLCGNWIEIAYGTSSGAVRVIVQHPETVGHGPQLFQTYTVHTAPVTKVALTTNHLISVCAEYNHVRSWGVTRFRGMISTQPGSTSLASFKVLTLDSTDDSLHCDSNDPGPFGEQDGEQVFVQRIVPDTNQVFVRLASNGDRLCTIRSVDGSAISAFAVHECEGSNRMGSRPRRFLFTGTASGSVQMWDLTTALDQYQARVASGGISSAARELPGTSAVTTGTQVDAKTTAAAALLGSRGLMAALQGPTASELLQLIDECELCCASLDSTPAHTPHASAVHLPGLD